MRQTFFEDLKKVPRLVDEVQVDVDEEAVTLTGGLGEDVAVGGTDDGTASEIVAAAEAHVVDEGDEPEGDRRLEEGDDAGGDELAGPGDAAVGAGQKKDAEEGRSAPFPLRREGMALEGPSASPP